MLFLKFSPDQLLGLNLSKAQFYVFQSYDSLLKLSIDFRISAFPLKKMGEGKALGTRLGFKFIV